MPNALPPKRWGCSVKCCSRHGSARCAEECSMWVRKGEVVVAEQAVCAQARWRHAVGRRFSRAHTEQVAPSVRLRQTVMV